jgi:small subunit ribosomal protein S20
MPIIKSAQKRVRVTARQTEKNHLHRSRARTALKRIRDLTAAGKTDEAAAHVATAQKYLDKAAKVGAFSNNTVSRYKSNLAASLKKAGVKGATAPAKKASTTKKAAPKTAAKKPAAKKAPAKKPAPKKSAK